jgi:hypothetical protein
VFEGGNFLKMRVCEICVKQIRVNQGLVQDLFEFIQYLGYSTLHGPLKMPNTTELQGCL